MHFSDKNTEIAGASTQFIPLVWSSPSIRAMIPIQDVVGARNVSLSSFRFLICTKLTLSQKNLHASLAKFLTTIKSVSIRFLSNRKGLFSINFEMKELKDSQNQS